MNKILVEYQDDGTKTVTINGVDIPRVRSVQASCDAYTDNQVVNIEVFGDVSFINNR